MTASYALLVHCALRPGTENTFDALAARTVRRIQEHEPGTLVYVIHGTGTPGERVCYELYRDREAFDLHERQPHVREFLAARAALLAAEPGVTVLSPIGSPGPAQPPDSPRGR